MNTENKWGNAGGVALLAAALLVGGCAHPASSGSGAGGAHSCHLYAGLDTSASWRPYLGVSATLCARQALALDPDRDFLTLYRLDSSTREFSDGPAPESSDRLQRVIVREAASVSDTRGTFPARFWNTVAGRAEGDTGTVVIEIYSDADNDDMTAQSQADICRSARRLAANPHVRGVWVFGAQPRNWSTLRREFGPLRDRFHLCSPAEMTMQRVASAVP